MHTYNWNTFPYGFSIAYLEQGEFIRTPDGSLFPFRRAGLGKMECQVDLLKWRIIPEGWHLFSSISGDFLCDENGDLRGFYPDEKNDVSTKDAQGAQINRIFRHLIIPEGVRQIGSFDGVPAKYSEEWFRTMTVLEEIRFPDSLRGIGACCFANSTLPEMVFPAMLEKLSGYAFGGSNIQRLIIPEHMKNIVMDYSGVIHPEKTPPEGVLWITGRNFKESTIEELVCPECFAVSLLMPEAKIGMRTELVSGE